MLLDQYQRLAGNVRRVTVTTQDAPEGPRIGGSAPVGVLPTNVDSSTQYFATVWLDDLRTNEVSLYVSLEADELSARSVYRNVSRLFSTNDFVQIVSHPKSRRSNSPSLASPLSGRALEIGDETPDVVVEPGDELPLPSKLGGSPYFYYYAPDYIGALNDLFRDGFALFLQMTWAGLKASPAGPWPFDEYTFHLLAKETPVGIDWRYGWG